MVQSINTKALLTLASVVRRPGLMTPHVAVDTVSQLNYDALKSKCGIQAIIFDKDNTLTAPYDNQVHSKAKQGLEKAIEIFGYDNVAILSNSAGTNDDPDDKDATAIEQSIGIKVIRHVEKKPGGLTEVLNHFSIQDPAALCMIGDRLLTDVVFGNLHGMLTVHTLPLCSGEENSRDNTIAKIVRGAENKALYGNWFGGRWLLNAKMEHKFWQGEDDCPLVLKPEEGEEDDEDEEEEEYFDSQSQAEVTTTTTNNDNLESTTTTTTSLAEEESSPNNHQGNK